MTDRRVLALYDERMLDHKPEVKDPFLPGRLERRVREILQGLDVKWNYPEHPGRLTAITDLLRNEPIAGVEMAPGREATRDELARVHTTSYLDDVFALGGQSAWLDVDTTAVSAGSVTAARVAAGTSILAAETVLEGRADAAFALVRPPGHHAEPVRARGFCLFNNVAVAAAHAQAVHGIRRVLIVDWDAHHANGTQEIFYADPDVMLFDTHRASPFYPGSGHLEEVGAGAGEGTTVNVPLEGGAGDRALLAALDGVLAPAAEWFKPELILVSAGFDPHRLDLALNCSHEGFAAMTARLMALAERHCPGRLAFVLEGGYHLDALSRGVHTVLRTLAGAPAQEPAEPGIADVEAAVAYHGAAFTEQ